MKVVNLIAAQFLLLLLFTHCEEERLPPTSPELTSPVANAVDQEYDVTFTWNASDNVNSYTFQLSLTDDFSTCELNKENLTNTSFNVTNLKPSTSYFWQVNAVNGGGTSPWSSTGKFSTKALNVPSLTAPLANSIISPNNVTFEWSSVSGVTGYNLQVSTKADFATLIINQENQTSTIFTQPELIHSTTYYWKVSSVKNGISSPWSASNMLTTENLGVPSLVSPVNNLVNSTRSVEFEWSSISDAESYELQVSTINDFSSLVTIKEDLTQPLCTIDKLMFSTNYYWRVRAIKENKQSEWSSIRKLTTEPLGIPQLQSPSDNTQLTSNIVEFNWSAVNEATSYNLQVSSNADFSTVVLNKSGVETLSYISSLPQTISKYYWRVNAQIENCQSEWSLVRSLYTPQIPLDGLVAWYPFNGNANDESGNENHGSVFGATLSEDRVGSSNKAYSFDGVNDYIKITNPSSLNFPDGVSFTVSFFYNPNSIVTNNSGFNGLISRFHNNTGPISGWQIGRDANNLRFEAIDPCSFNTLSTLSNGTWIHILQTYDRTNGQVKTYINGILTNTTNCTSINSSMINNYDLKIGVEREGFQFSSGKIDDIAIYNRILTNEEIQVISNN